MSTGDATRRQGSRQQSDAVVDHIDAVVRSVSLEPRSDDGKTAGGMSSAESARLQWLVRWNQMTELEQAVWTMRTFHLTPQQTHLILKVATRKYPFVLSAIEELQLKLVHVPVETVIDDVTTEQIRQAVLAMGRAIGEALRPLMEAMQQTLIGLEKIVRATQSLQSPKSKVPFWANDPTHSRRRR